MNILSKGHVFGGRNRKEPPLPAIEETSPPETPVPEPPKTFTINPAILATPIRVVSSNTIKKKRVMLCGTYPVGQSNGYSRVVYYISKYLGAKEDIDLTIYGFQNFRQTTASLRNDIPSNVKLHDAYAAEDPKRSGFGDKEIAEYIRKNPQDIVIIFNDMVVTSSLTKDIVEKLTPEERAQFKLISYMDQVYPYQRPEFIQLLNTHFDGVITFTKYWQGIIRQLGLKESIPTYYFPHGFDHTMYYPIPKKIARLYYDLPQDAFIILNLNRNQPRKRWDHTMMVLADIIERHQQLIKSNTTQKKVRPIKLMVATAFTGFWDIHEIFQNELRKRNIPLEVGVEYLATIKKPHQLSDRDINIMYNACDIGINTCEGEGFGLCQFEHLAVGCPQVVSNIGGFKEFLHKDNSILTEPKWFYYVDKQRDGIGGYAEVSDTKDTAEGIWKYYSNPNMVTKHGLAGRKEILQHYPWKTMVDILHRIVQSIKV